MSKRPRTIQIFLPSGDPSGIRTAEVTTSIVRVIEVPRSQIADFIKMPEAKQVGIYFLVGGEKEDQLYIGSSDELGKRLNQHHNKDEKDFSRALVLVSMTNNLTNTHALYLESLSIEKAAQCQRYELGNGNSGQRPYTPAPLKADCDEIHEVGSLLLATLGYPVFEPLLDNTSEDERIKFYCKRTGADASGYYTNEGFVVLKGSKGLLNPTAKKPREDMIAIREKLIEEGVISIDGNYTVFNRDHLFKSPSGASCVLVMNATNGWREWRTSDGRTLAEIHRHDTESTEETDS